MVYDVLIIGAGVIGTLIAKKLSSYELNVCVLEKGSDVRRQAGRGKQRYCTCRL